MRRGVILVILLFLATASCYYRPVMVGERPAYGRLTPTAQPCRVIARTKCALEQCRGAHMDLVTLQCLGSRQTRCVASLACSAQ